MPFYRTLLLTLPVSFLLLHMSQALRAEGVNCVVSSSSTVALEEDPLPLCSELYPDYLYENDTSPWKIGFSAGVGKRSNPLLNADDIPIYGIIQLSYFGDKFFFDNGDIGWALAEHNQWSVNAIAGVGGERSFFSHLNTSSVGFSPLANNSQDLVLSPSPPLGEGVEMDMEVELPDRHYTIDGGLEFLYHTQNSALQLQLLTDLSGRHKGQGIWLSWARPLRMSRWEIIPSLGMNWKSSAAANYYYGVSEEEAMPGLPAYDVDSSTNFFGRVAVSYTFNPHWKMVSVVQIEKLASEITASPMVEDDYIQTGFIGLYYEF